MEAGLSPSATSGRLVFLASCLVFILTAQATTVRYCDKQADYKVKVKEVEINPNPVIRGKPAAFRISAFAEDAISGGKVKINVKYFGIHVHEETHELCDETSCPVLGGDFVISHSEALPSFTPPGSYTLTMDILGDDGYHWTCVSFDFKIKIASSVAES